ncbi:MAG: SLC13 family permease [Pseudomonadales bacterium]|nr:SLC13 family permease [Pseudomonadales bacterium]
MNEVSIVFLTIIGAGIAMASNRVRYDVIALLVVVCLTITEVLSVSQAVAGFGSSVVLLVGCLLIIGDMLDKTGVARGVGDWILQKGGQRQGVLLILIMVCAALLSSVMSSTAVVAIFIPIVLRIAQRTGIASSQMLLPMSYAALISGMITLIATPPNLVVSDELKSAGFEPLGFFSFAPLGLLVLAFGTAFCIVFGKKLLPTTQTANTSDELPSKTFLELWDEFNLDERVLAYRVSSDSPLIGKTLAQSRLHSDYGVRVLARIKPGRQSDHVQAVAPQLIIDSGDILLVTEAVSNDTAAHQAGLLSMYIKESRMSRWFWDLGGSVVLIHPDSRLVGQNVISSEFRSNFGLQVMGIRHAENKESDICNHTFKTGDMLFVVGSWSKIQRLQTYNHDLVLLELPSEFKEKIPAHKKAYLAVGIVVGMVLLKLLNIVPLVIAALLAAMAAVMTRCLSVNQAYRAVNLSSLILIAGMLPLATALEITGGSQLIVENLMAITGESAPSVMMMALFGLTAVLTLVLSNTASAVLVTPIAIASAAAMNVSPYPMAIAVLLAASAAFSSPVATPVVTLVVEPGKYRFIDFIRMGLPMLMITALVCWLFTPILFPFN